MNIVQICPTPFLSLGGPARNYIQFHLALDTRPIVFIRPGEGIGEQMVVPSLVNIRTINFPLLTRYYYAKSSQLNDAKFLVESSDCVIIHNFYRFPAAWGARVALEAGIPYIVVLHGILDPWVLRKNMLLKRAWLAIYGRKILRNAAVVLCATEREKSKAQIYFPSEKGKVVRWAVELPSSNIGNSKRDHLRQTLGFTPNDRVLIFFGRLDSMKQPLETVRLLASIRDDRLKLIVVGPDADVSKVQLEKVANSERWKGLRVIGPCFNERKYDYLRAADAYISLSHRENFNFTAAEAMLCGRPLILSVGNDLGWDFADQGFSWQLRSTDPDEARSAVQTFLRTPADRLAAMGRASIAWASVNLSQDRFEMELKNVVEGCIRRTGARGTSSIA
jgi:glycosyltransferase involved in cell wall biosynthesis